MNAINVRKFIQENYTPYDGDAGFLAGPTERTTKLWNEVLELMKQERSAGGVLDFDTKIISDITSHAAGYIDKELEQIVGLQTDEPLKRAIMPFGGIRVVRTSAGRTTAASWTRKWSDDFQIPQDPQRRRV